MTSTLDEILDVFRKQVQKLLDQVQQVENEVFRKALYISMLDGLSACAYGNAMRSGDRFRDFILQIGGWTDGERISLPQAALLFQADPNMSAAISAQLTNWTWGVLQPITSDPFAQQLPAHADLWKMRHVNLLWKFRNSLLHAVYDPSGFDPGSRVKPFYVGDVSTHTWRLVIPEEFLRSLLTASLQGLLSFCKKEGRDPQAHLGKELWV